MPESTQPALESIRAYVEYFRDLGIHDFFPAGEPASLDVSALISASPAISQPQIATEPPRFPLATAVPPQIIPELESLIPPSLVSLTALLPASTTPTAPAERAAALEAIHAEIGDCTRCPLAYGGRRRIVFADGDPNARLMFVGEGPGADEDEQGIPFVGASGKLLNNMITAMGLSREQVYIANIVKCRPPANRNPEPVEANTCTPFLARQIDIVQPEVIVALGAIAATYLLGVKQSLASLRGKFHTVRGIKTVITYHPAFLLRDPRQKGEAWKDLQLVMAEMGLKR
jgi:DNA polymerase